MRERWNQLLAAFSGQGMLGVLLLVCVLLSAATVVREEPTGPLAGTRLAQAVLERFGPTASVLVVAGEGAENQALAESLRRGMIQGGITPVAVVVGDPVDTRHELEALSRAGTVLDAIACSSEVPDWLVLRDLPRLFPVLGTPALIVPDGSAWPRFLTRENLLNIMGQITVIAIVAVGMTLVVVVGGIDLSVGSLIGLSAIVCADWISRHGGGENAGVGSMVVGGLLAVVLCGAVGTAHGTLVALLGAPPFLVTLGVMLMARGTAQEMTNGESIANLPERFVWLGRDTTWGMPNGVLLMLGLFVAAGLMLRWTVLGRHMLAVGGNIRAARLAGVPVNRVMVTAYTLCGLLAGLGGVVLASQLKSASPTYGEGYELMVIASVVVGGTSLAGGQGGLFGTLVGALLIAVINNGMNLLGISPFAQKIVLGSVILMAVLLDRLRRRGS